MEMKHDIHADANAMSVEATVWMCSSFIPEGKNTLGVFIAR